VSEPDVSVTYAYETGMHYGKASFLTYAISNQASMPPASLVITEPVAGSANAVEESADSGPHLISTTRSVL